MVRKTKMHQASLYYGLSLISGQPFFLRPVPFFKACPFFYRPVPFFQTCPFCRARFQVQTALSHYLI